MERGDSDGPGLITSRCSWGRGICGCDRGIIMPWGIHEVKYDDLDMVCKNWSAILEILRQRQNERDSVQKRAIHNTIPVPTLLNLFHRRGHN